METQLPAGTVTFLFTDIEGSTKLMRDFGDGYGEVLADHHRLVREHLGRRGGRDIDTQGDAFFFCFTRARDAVAGAVATQQALAGHAWHNGADVRVRMGLHTGEPAVGTEGYHGVDVVRAARICSAGRGGQILLSETTRALIGDDLPDGISVVDLGRHDLEGFSEQHLFQLTIAGTAEMSPELKAKPAEQKSDAEVLGDAFGERIERFVQQKLERSLSGVGERPPPQPQRSTAPQILAVVILGVIALIVVVRYAFF